MVDDVTSTHPTIAHIQPVLAMRGDCRSEVRALWLVCRS
jgi:hypothetical protein